MGEQNDHQELPGPWAKTYAARSKEDMLEAYSEWSSTYDEDSVNKFGYISPKRSARVVSDHMQKLGFPKDSLIADIGAGTGLVGEELHQLGCTNIAALDYSQEMLEIAKKKSCYKDIFCVDLHDSPMDIQQKVGLAPGTFDVAVSVGTFTPNHVGIEALENVIRLIRLGGLLCLSLREDFVEDVSNGFRAKLDELEACGKLEKIDVTDPELYTAKVSKSIFFRCWIFKIL